MQNNPNDARQYTRGKYLKATELDKRRAVTVTIQKVVPTEFDDGQTTKLVISFLEIDQQMPLNKTQATALIEWFGYDIRLWVDKPIALRQGTTYYQGKQVPTILVEEPPIASPGPNAVNLPTDNDVVFENK